MYKFRENVSEFLMTMWEIFDVHIYTAGTRNYAIQIAKLLEKRVNSYIQSVKNNESNGKNNNNNNNNNNHHENNGHEIKSTTATTTTTIKSIHFREHHIISR